MQISVQHFDPIKWWNHEVQMKETCDIHAWHIRYCPCTRYTALTCELRELQALATRWLVVNIIGPVHQTLEFNRIHLFHSRHFTSSQSSVLFTFAALFVSVRVGNCSIYKTHCRKKCFFATFLNCELSKNYIFYFK